MSAEDFNKAISDESIQFCTAKALEELKNIKRVLDNGSKASGGEGSITQFAGLVDKAIKNIESLQFTNQKSTAPTLGLGGSNSISNEDD